MRSARSWRLRFESFFVSKGGYLCVSSFDSAAEEGRAAVDALAGRGAETPAALTIPPSHAPGVNSRVLIPCRAACTAEATPPVPPPQTTKGTCVVEQVLVADTVIPKHNHLCQKAIELHNKGS